MWEQQRTQQQMLLELLTKQQEEMALQKQEIEEIRRREKEPPARVKLPKPTLQKLSPSDDVEHYVATFERIATQQAWPEEVWAVQLAGLLTGKALAAYASLGAGEALDYKKVKAAIFRRYEISEETHRQRFRQDRRKETESYREWADRLKDHFVRWTKGQDIPLEELVLLEQFLQGAPEDLRVWLRERKPKTLREVAELADDYVIARKEERRTVLRKQPPLTAMGGGLRQHSERKRGPRNGAPPHRSGSIQDGRARTNARGDIKCYNCNRYGHLMYNCPNRTSPDAAATTKALYGNTYCSPARDMAGQRHRCWGRIDNKWTCLMVDTGCDMSMVSGRYVHPAKVNWKETVPVQCVHGDTVEYPTAAVTFLIGGEEQMANVAVAPDLPVPALLGRDLYDVEVAPHQRKGLLVVTRSRSKTQASNGPGNSNPTHTGQSDSLDTRPQR